MKKPDETFWDYTYKTGNVLFEKFKSLILKRDDEQEYEKHLRSIIVAKKGKLSDEDIEYCLTNHTLSISPYHPQDDQCSISLFKVDYTSPKYGKFDNWYTGFVTTRFGYITISKEEDTNRFDMIYNQVHYYDTYYSFTKDEYKLLQMATKFLKNVLTLDAAISRQGGVQSVYLQSISKEDATPR